MIERIYVVPLRLAWRFRHRSRRAEAAMRFLRRFVARHMKTRPEMVKISNEVNEKVWSRSMNNPPSKIKVRVVKDDRGYVYVELAKEEAKDAGNQVESTEKS